MNERTLREVTQHDSPAFYHPNNGIRFMRSDVLKPGEVMIVDDLPYGIRRPPEDFGFAKNPHPPRQVWSAYERKLRQIIKLESRHAPSYGALRWNGLGIWLMIRLDLLGLGMGHYNLDISRWEMFKKTFYRLIGINKNWWPLTDRYNK